FRDDAVMRQSGIGHQVVIHRSFVLLFVVVWCAAFETRTEIMSFKKGVFWISIGASSLRLSVVESIGFCQGMIRTADLLFSWPRRSFLVVVYSVSHNFANAMLPVVVPLTVVNQAFTMRAIHPQPATEKKRRRHAFYIRIFRG
ncbi:MAG TPA: hypothetical protein VI750_07645, partial [Pyrinomonadaceae bacterium]|nr:hypothetical protein [Pyrinomonadaceae bacterium]